MFADLHVHTCFSDGTYSPEEVVGHAKRLGLVALSVTDHDTVEGCARAAAACQAAGLEFITGVELTAEQEESEIHILGYFIDPQHPQLLAELAHFQTVRQNRIYQMVAKLNALGVPLRPEVVFSLANCQCPGRPHVARALVAQRLCGDLDEAFERFLKRGKPAWVPKFKISAHRAIQLIHQAAGLAVLAHPGLNYNDDVIPSLVEAGLDGMECFHTKHSTAMTERYLELAEQYQLVVTGGSDCHGTSKGPPLLGTIKLPYTHVEALKTRWAERVAQRGFLLAQADPSASSTHQTPST
jgi:predicted metal-dependent phosphoesterase TrpH